MLKKIAHFFDRVVNARICKNQTLIGKRVVLDGSKLIGCTLRKCDLIFYGVDRVHLESNKIEDCPLVLAGPAATTIEFTQSWNHQIKNSQIFGSKAST